jgi:hypothetical protein
VGDARSDLADAHPFQGENWQYVHPPEKQPYIHWIVRLAVYAQLKGKSVEYMAEIAPLIWSGEVEHWPAHVKERFNRIQGLDYDEAIRFIRENPAKVDDVWLENSRIQAQAGHGGVPLMIFRGEPFFGQDRFDQLFWRLRQSRLTGRKEPRAPFVEKPLRWPDSLRVSPLKSRTQGLPHPDRRRSRASGPSTSNGFPRASDRATDLACTPAPAARHPVFA